MTLGQEQQKSSGVLTSPPSLHSSSFLTRPWPRDRPAGQWQAPETGRASLLKWGGGGVEGLQGPSYHLHCGISLETAPRITPHRKRTTSHILCTSTSGVGARLGVSLFMGQTQTLSTLPQQQDSTQSLIQALSSGFLASSPWDRTLQVQTTLPSAPASPEHLTGHHVLAMSVPCGPGSSHSSAWCS